MWPSQRAQNLLFQNDSTDSTVKSSGSRSQQRLASTGGITSKIEIRHTRMSSPSNFNPASNASSLNYVSDANRKVTFSPSTLRSPGGLPQNIFGNPDLSASTFSSRSSVTTATDTPSGKVYANANELVGQVVIQTVCNRTSITDVLGSGCKCPVQLSKHDVKRIKEMDPEKQQEEICKLMIQLVQEREKRNEELVEVEAQQKLVASKKFIRHPKVRHILCVSGRTMDGTGIPMGSFPNTFSEMKYMIDLRRDPSGFKRFTGKADMKGFSNEEIIISNEGNILKFTGVRRKQDRKSAKVVTEEILLPSGVYADTLRIGRNSKGVLIVQEPWKF